MKIQNNNSPRHDLNLKKKEKKIYQQVGKVKVVKEKKCIAQTALAKIKIINKRFLIHVGTIHKTTEA